ncbi:BrnT family toxin [uncultured Methylobacterium sp.]|jgi:uncharacterized DUF497 family protein|uniref:BrnT family toxin n=1 Tax=uncultured Methylobacterium sp. TaxID=157278 RepID=UPI00261FDD40|nr:BrnT family toxin [uncultured Methylobacterium sp.]
MAEPFDPTKRDKTRIDRGLDFADAGEVFAGPTYTFEDTRRDDGEKRFVTIGSLRGRMVVVGWTPRDGEHRIVTMRKANDREQKKYAALLR